jgi:hypothetical protein
MLVYLTGVIDGLRDIERFKQIEKDVRAKDKCWLINLIDIEYSSDNKYRINRLKSVLKSDKILFASDPEKDIITKMEYSLAEFLNIPVEVYNDKDFD